MTSVNRGVVFECDGDRLVGVLTAPERDAGKPGVLLVVGGPQYRVGSHRQFALLARNLAEQGSPVFRFDYRGMGDSDGAPRPFAEIDSDIRAAIDAFLDVHPSTTRVVLWGLCDGASAAMIYAPTDPRVCGLVLINPWVRDAQTQAATQVKHYYGGRILSGAFWRKLVSGKVSIADAIGGLVGSSLSALRGGGGPEQTANFRDRMLAGWQRHSGPSLVLLSGNDLTAREFLELSARDPRWRARLADPRTRRMEMPQADHTFSTAQWRVEVEGSVSDWLRGLT